MFHPAVSRPRGSGRTPGMDRLLRFAVITLLAALPSGCGSDLLLGPDADQGIDGVALRGPLCPVVSQDDPCPDEPYSAWIRIGEEGGGQVTRVRSGTDGRFRVGLKPGRYVVEGESGDPFPRGERQAVEVEVGVWSEITVSFDTGIR